MISLREAITLLSLKDNDTVYICSRHCDNNATFITVKQIRNKYDMRKTMVKNKSDYNLRK